MAKANKADFGRFVGFLSASSHLPSNNPPSDGEPVSRLETADYSCPVILSNNLLANILL